MLDADVMREAARQLREGLRESIAKAIPVPATPEDTERLRDAAIELMLDSLDSHGKVLGLTLQVDSLRTKADGALVEEKARADKAEENARAASAEVVRLRGLVGEVEDQKGWEGCSRAEAIRQADKFHAEMNSRANLLEAAVAENGRLSEEIAVLRAENERLAQTNRELVSKAVVAQTGGEDTITIPTPSVPFPGSKTQADYMRTAASRIEESRLFGRNVTATVVKALSDIAEALAARENAADEAAKTKEKN